MDNLVNQRDTYKLVEKLTSGKFKSEIDLLKSLVRHIVTHKEFEINGGRIWELSNAGSSYTLKYQYGKVKKIPNDYTMAVSDHPAFRELPERRTFLQKETDELLKKKGIELKLLILVRRLY